MNREEIIAKMLELVNKNRNKGHLATSLRTMPELLCLPKDLQEQILVEYESYMEDINSQLSGQLAKTLKSVGNNQDWSNSDRWMVLPEDEKEKIAFLENLRRIERRRVQENVKPTNDRRRIRQDGKR